MFRHDKLHVIASQVGVAPLVVGVVTLDGGFGQQRFQHLSRQYWWITTLIYIYIPNNEACI